MFSLQKGFLKRPWVRYGIAVVAVAVGFGLRRMLTVHVGETLPTYITFYPAVMVAALLAGLGPGFLATALTVLVVDYWISSPKDLFVHMSPAEAAGAVLFSCMGVFLSVLTELYRRAREQAVAYEKELALRESEQAPRESEAQFRAMFEVASVGFVQVEPRTGRLLRFNDKYCQITGYPAEELLALRFPDLTHPDDRASDWEIFSRAVRGETSDYRNEKRYVRKDGSVIWVRVNAAFIRDAASQPSRTVAVCEDITDRKQAEERLRESESFCRQTLESMPGMVFTKRPDGYCDYQSQQWVEFTGIPMSEHLGDGWNRLLHPDDQPRAFAAWCEAVAGRAPYDLEYRVRRHDGEYEWFKVRGRLIRDAAGNIVRWFGTALNIEDLMRAEERLKASLREKEVLLQEIHHRVKNNLQVISSLISLQADALDQPALRTSLNDVRNRVRTMALVHETRSSTSPATWRG